MATLEQSGWAHLPPELLDQIAARITQIPDLVRFSSVCVQWRSAARPSSSLLPPQLPWLLLPADEGTTTHRLFFNPADNRTYSLPLPEARTHANNMHSPGSGGWLPTRQDFKTLALVYPMTHSSVPLPPLPLAERGTHWLTKAKLFGSHPFAAHFHNIGDVFLCGLGEGSWRRIEGERYNSCVDFVYHDEGFYIRRFSAISIFDAHTLEKIRRVHVPPGSIHDYLIESAQGELLLVRMEPGRRKVFKVFRLDSSDENVFFVELTSIGDNVLFVDGVQAMAFCAGNFEGCRGNRIYLVDYLGGDAKGLKLFDVEKGQIEQVPLFPFTPERNWATAVWVVPSLGY